MGQVKTELPYDARYVVKVDPISGELYVGGSAYKLTVLDKDLFKVATINLPYTPGSAWVDAAHGKVYASHWNARLVSVVDMHTGEVESLSVGADPSAIVADSSRGQVFVINTAYPENGTKAQASTMSVIDVSSLSSENSSWGKAATPHVSAAETTALEWISECIDCPRAIHGLQERNIAIDSAGNPHLAYGSDSIYQTWHNGTRWYSETVTGPGAGGHVSMALDAEDDPHISCWNDADDELMYVRREDGRWVNETVDSDGYVGLYTSIALDSQGFPHISYYDFGEGSLKYARWTGSAWDIQVVDGDGGVGWHSSLALDSADNPHVSYYDNFNQTLKYAHWTGNEWEITVISAYTTYYSSLAIDAEDNVYVAYNYWYDGGEIKFVHRTSTVWSGWRVETAATVFSNVGPISLRLDESGQPRLSYFSGYYSNYVNYVQKTSNGWERETVEWNRVNQAVSLALDAAGKPYLAYYHPQLRDLRVTQLEGEDWFIETVDHDGIGGTDRSLALDSSGKPDVLYKQHFSQGGDVMLNQWTGAGWDEELMANCHSVAFDSLDQPHLSCSSYNGVFHTYWNGSSWTTEQATTYYAYSYHDTFIALDSFDRPHIAYTYYGDQPAYVYWNGSQWVNQILGPTGWTRALALDANDYPHIGYEYERWYGASSEVDYAFWDGAQWIFEAVDDARFGSSAMVLDANGVPHFSYCPNGFLVYAHLVEDVWYSQVVDGVECYRSSIALDSEQSPHIAFVGYQNHALKYARRDGDSWKVVPAATEGHADEWSEITLKLDSFDNLYITYHDETNADFKLAMAGGRLRTIYLPLMFRSDGAQAVFATLDRR